MTPRVERIKPAHPRLGKTLPNIERWKYDLVRRAMLEVLPAGGEGMLFKDLPEAVARRMTRDELSQLGSVSWYVISVKLALEGLDEIERVPGATPQRLRRK